MACPFCEMERCACKTEHVTRAEFDELGQTFADYAAATGLALLNAQALLRSIVAERDAFRETLLAEITNLRVHLAATYGLTGPKLMN